MSGDGDRVVVTSATRSPLALAVKRLAQALYGLWVAPRLLAYRLAATVFGRDRAFLAASESIARIPGMHGVYCRQAFYRRTLAECGRDCYFGWLSTVSMPACRVGEGAYIGRRCSIGFADIGPAAMLADGVQVLSGGHEHGRACAGDDSHQERPQEFRRMRIGAGAWIGTNAVVMADVGERTVVGAGAVVNRPLPAGVVAAGVPARVVKGP